MEQLKCDRCDVIYTDKESIEFAKKGEDRWKASCREDGMEPRGIAPCPTISCPGQLTLEVLEKSVENTTQCPSCGVVHSEILASHNYTISYDEEQEKWVKEVGSAIYVCGNCHEELGTGDIEAILRQVDEL